MEPATNIHAAAVAPIVSRRGPRPSSQKLQPQPSPPAQPPQQPQPSQQSQIQPQPPQPASSASNSKFSKTHRRIKSESSADSPRSNGTPATQIPPNSVAATINSGGSTPSPQLGPALHSIASPLLSPTTTSSSGSASGSSPPPTTMSSTASSSSSSSWLPRFFRRGNNADASSVASSPSSGTPNRTPSPSPSPSPGHTPRAGNSPRLLSANEAQVIVTGKYSWPCLLFFVEQHEELQKSVRHQEALAIPPTTKHHKHKHHVPQPPPPPKDIITPADVKFCHEVLVSTDSDDPDSSQELLDKYQDGISENVMETAQKAAAENELKGDHFLFAVLEVLTEEVFPSFFDSFPRFNPFEPNKTPDHDIRPATNVSAPVKIVTEKDMQDMPTALDLLESVQFDNLSRSTDFTELPALTSTTTYQQMGPSHSQIELSVSPNTRIQMAKFLQIYTSSPSSTPIATAIQRGKCQLPDCDCDQYYGTSFGPTPVSSSAISPPGGLPGALPPLPPRFAQPDKDKKTLPRTLEPMKVTNRLARSSENAISDKPPMATPINGQKAKSESVISSTPPSLAKGNKSSSMSMVMLYLEVICSEGANAWAISWGEVRMIEREPFSVGQFAKLYKGMWRNQKVAVKVLKEQPDKRAIEDFKLEFQLLSSLRSPHIVYFYGAVLEPRVCLILEYCSKGSLFSVMKSEPSFTWDNLFQFAVDSLRGLVCLHSWKPQLLHRDLKSNNILISDIGTAKLCDFGTTRYNDNSDTLYKVRGTYAYCCPEIYTGGAYTSKSDMFSFSVILWEMVSRCLKGEYMRPYSEYSDIQMDFQILLQVVKKNLRPTLHPSCPPQLESVIRAGWQGSADGRPTASEMLESLLDMQQQYLAKQKKWNKLLRVQKLKTKQDTL